MTTLTSRKAEYLLLSFGLLLGLVLAGGLYLYINRRHAGQDFASLADLRKSMLESSGPLTGRSTELRDILNPHPDDLLIYDLRPNLNVTFQGVNVRTNSCGMRERELPYQKASNTYRIAVLGDSFAFGWGVDEDKAFPRALERLLNERTQSGLHFEVLNFGVPGYSTFQEASIFKEKAQDYNPDAILVYFVENDFGLPFFVRDLNNSDSLMPGNVLARMSWSDSNQRAKEEVRRHNKFNANRSLYDLATYTQSLGIPVLVAINPRPKWADDYSRLKGARGNPGITMINMWPEFIRIVESRQLPSEKLTLSGDPHPTALKHGIYAEVLAPYILSITR